MTLRPHLLHAERGRLQQISIDSWYAAPAGRPAASQPHAAAAVDRRDGETGQTNRRMNGRTASVFLKVLSSSASLRLSDNEFRTVDALKQ